MSITDLNKLFCLNYFGKLVLFLLLLFAIGFFQNLNTKVNKLFCKKRSVFWRVLFKEDISNQYNIEEICLYSYN